MKLTLRQALAVVLVFVVASVVTRAVVDAPGSDGTQFSEEELRLRDELDGNTEALLLSHRSIESLWPGYWYDCADTVHYSLQYSIDSNGNVTHIETTESTDLSPAKSEYCDSESGSWVNTSLSLARDKGKLINAMRAERDLSAGSQEELATRVAVEAQRLGSDYEVSDGRWLSTEGLGDSSYGLSYTVVNENEGEFEFFRFQFIRGVVTAAVAMKFPPGAVTDGDALSLAMEFDARIESKVASVEAARR